MMGNVYEHAIFAIPEQNGTQLPAHARRPDVVAPGLLHSLQAETRMRGVLQELVDERQHSATLFVTQFLCRTEKRHFNRHCHLLLPQHLHDALYCFWPLRMCNHHRYVTITSDGLLNLFEVWLRSVDEPEHSPAQCDLCEVAPHHSPAKGNVTSGLNYTTTKFLCQLTQQLVPLCLK